MKIDDFADGKWIEAFAGFSNSPIRKPVWIRKHGETIQIKTPVSLINDNGTMTHLGLYFEETDAAPFLTMDIPRVENHQTLELVPESAEP